MKKILLSVLTACSLFCAQAATPTLNWAYAIDTNYANDQIGTIAKTSDNNIVTFSHFASQKDGDNLSYNGEVIAYGAVTSTEGRNLLVIKHDNDGKKVWAVYSKNGYFDAGTGSVIATPDGGVVVLAKPRASQQTDKYVEPQLVDATGAEIDFPEFPTLNWTYNTVLIKISSEGAVQWVRQFAMDELPIAGTDKATTDAVTPYGLTVDTTGNIYIAGNFRAPMVFTGEKNSHYILQPRNVTSSTTSGGLFLVKLNSEGDFVGQVKAEGAVTREQISGLAYDNGKIYFFGNVQGTADATLTVGDKSITLENDLDGLMYGCVAEDLTVDYLKYVKAFGSTDGKHTTQAKAIRVLDGELYLLGLVKGGFAPAGAADAQISSATTTLDRFLIRCATADGNWTDAVAQNNSGKISGYFDVFKYNDNLYAYGYAMDSTVGVFIDQYNGNKLELVEQQSLINGGGSPTTAAGCVLNSEKGNVVVSIRGNNEFKFSGSETTITPLDKKYGCALASFNLAGETTSAEVATSALTTYSADETAIIVTTNNDLEVNIYNVAGVQVASQKVAAGTTRISLPKGIYIVNDTKLIVG
jgi:hypothetical protein